MPRTGSPLSRWDNSQIANAIRLEASSEYQKHIPIATQANLDVVLRELTRNPQHRNEFETAFVNKIARQEINYSGFENPLAKFKGESVQYGDTIEEIQVGLLEAVAHSDSVDGDDNEVWKRNLPTVDVSYHTSNRYHKYKVTIPDYALRGAFLNEGGLARYAAALMQSAITSDARDEYLLMRELFAKYEDNGGFFHVNVADITASTATEAQSKDVLKKLRAWAGKLQFLSDLYNVARMPVSATPDELELFITPEANASVDVDALAGAFNIDRAEFASRTTLVDEIPIPGAVAILTTRKFFQVYDQINTTAQIANPSQLTVNHWLHRKQIVSVSRFVPAILFWTGPGDDVTENELVTATISQFTINTNDEDKTPVIGPDYEVARGVQYIVDGYGLDADGVSKTATRLILDGATGDRTFITQKGVLEIDQGEESAELTLTQIALDDPTKTRAITLTVTGDVIRTYPNPAVLDAPEAPAGE